MSDVLLFPWLLQRNNWAITLQHLVSIEFILSLVFGLLNFLNHGQGISENKIKFGQNVAKLEELDTEQALQ